MMNRFSARYAFSFAGTLVACGGVSDGRQAVDDTTGRTQEELRVVGDDPIVSRTARPTVRRGPPPITVPDPIFSQGPPNDLRPDGAMLYYDESSSDVGVEIGVVNVGWVPVQVPFGRVDIGGYDYMAILYQYPDGTSTAANTLNGGDRGYLKVTIPSGMLSHCSSFPVQIDLDHTMQSGPDPFGNDARIVLAYETGKPPCRLTWTTPINGATLGKAPDKREDGKSLQDIVSSIEIARPDGQACSNCHYRGGPSTNDAPVVYRPDVAQNARSSPIGPFQPLSGNLIWACGPTPWASQFIDRLDKPQYLKDAFQKWLDDGFQP